MYKEDYEYIKSCLQKTSKQFPNILDGDKLWYSNDDTLITVARILNNEFYFETPTEVIHFFERPYAHEDKMQELLDSYASEFDDSKDTTSEFKELDNIDD